MKVADKIPVLSKLNTITNLESIANMQLSRLKTIHESYRQDNFQDQPFMKVADKITFKTNHL